MRRVLFVRGFTRISSASLKGLINADKFRLFAIFVLAPQIFSAFFSPVVFAQSDFINTTRQDFESGVLHKVDVTSSPGDVKLAVKPKASWWAQEYSGRFQIKIENNDGKELLQGYTIALSFDHASLVSGGKSLESGDDIRVVYSPPGEEPVEVDRILEDGSLWNISNTTILFKTQTPISPKSTDADYYLYFGNPRAKDPYSDPKKVFAFFEDFEDYPDYGKPNGWDKTDWAVDFEVSTDTSYSGDKSLKVFGEARDVAVFTHTPIGQDYTVSVRFLSKDSKTEGGIYFRSYDHPSPFNNRPYPHFGFFDGFYQLNSGRGLHLWDSCQPPQCPAPKKEDWNTFKLKVVGKKVLEAKANGKKIWWKNQSLPVELPDDQGPRVGVVFRDSRPIYYDDFALILGAEDEPEVTLVEEGDEYEKEGSLESAPIDGGRLVSWDKISWKETLALGTDISFQVAKSSDGQNWSAWLGDLVNPEGSHLPFLGEARFIKYKAILTTTDPSKTPILHEVRVGVANTPPEITSLRLISSDDPQAFKTSTLTAQVESQDAEGDEVALSFVWYKNGQKIAAAPNSPQLTGEYFEKHDEISVLVTPNDGGTDGKSWQSGPIIVENSLPSVPRLISPADQAFISTNPPTLAWDASSDSDSDAIEYQVELDTFSDFSGAAKLTTVVLGNFYTLPLTLTEGQYFWRVKASDGEEESQWSNSRSFVLDVTWPATAFVKKPDNLTNKDQAQFLWKGSDNYSPEIDLVFSTRLDSGSWTGFSSATSAVFASLTDGLHTFEVKAQDLAGNVEESASYTWEIDTTPPDLPENFSAQASDSKIELSWSAVSNPDLAGYNLYRATGEDGKFQRLNVNLLTTTDYIDTSVNNETRYYYKISSVDELANESSLSASLGVTPQAPRVVTQTTVAIKTEELPTPSPTPAPVSPVFLSSSQGQILGASTPLQPSPAPTILGGRTKDSSGQIGLFDLLPRALGLALALVFAGASGYFTAQYKRLGV